MADFFSQFQVHPPQVPIGPNMGNEGQYPGVPIGAQPWQQGPGGPVPPNGTWGEMQPPYATAPPGSTMPNPNDGRQTGPEWGGWGNDFPNLGGFQQGGDSGWNTGYAGGLPPPPTKPGGYGGPVDPLLTTQPQPYQQGPGGTQPSVIGGTIGQRLNNPQPSVIGGTVGVNTGGPAQDPRLQQLLAQHQGGFFGNIAQALASPKLQALLPTLGTPAGRLALMQQQPPMGGVFGNVAQAVTSPAFQQIAQQYGNPDVAQAISGAAGNLSGGIGQPMNPSQQSGMVLMQSPDGLHMQNVPQEHVAHYTGLGATQVTGPQLTGSSYGGGNGQ